MIATIQPSTLTGAITAPASKSSMQRACAAALLHVGQSIIQNPGTSNDDQAAIKMIQDLGATVEFVNDTMVVNSKGVASSSTHPSGGLGGAVVNCGESGLGIRMFTPVAALSNEPITINGKGSLLTRPMDFFDEVLPQVGVQITSNNGKLPLQIQGPLQPQNITVDGSLSSQFLTGLLFAYAASTKEDATITVTNLKSKPYIDLSLKVLLDFGYNITNNNYESFTIHPKKSQTSTINYTVEGDWSGAAFLLVAGAIAGEITVKRLDVFSTQADKKILEALQDSGCRLSIQDKQIEVGPAALKAFHFNATDCPDLFPPLVALAAYCEGKTVIEGVSRLAHKESDRGITLQDEFGKMGLEIVLQGDLMIINGGKGLKGAHVHSRHDHRIAMACATAGLRTLGDVIIDEAEAINKSYPDFYKHLEKLGASITIV
ncbi:3-phosphoshikimate 1-carboxyvinyltransferase [Parasediminibacterium paludis]|uniref:3-phosphoshikimate 1-carboxyvinyltransferase n=1 Tax=Parasediminibacterium paludis TaxID=908966 RepID=A0ABV8PY94_9BACT